MTKHVLSIACLCLLVWAGPSIAAGEGVVVEKTLETIKIEEWGKIYTFVMSNELQTNTETEPEVQSNARLKDMKMGDKVRLFGYIRDGDLIFTGIRRLPPSDVGIVTELGKDTLTIQNDKGGTTFYKVRKDLANNSQTYYSSAYPSRFTEVTVGCRVEIIAYKQDGEMVLSALDVKKDKGKDK